MLEFVFIYINDCLSNFLRSYCRIINFIEIFYVFCISKKL